MYQATVQEFQAAVVARCFIVGFRFYRQSAVAKARLSYALSNAIQSEVFGNVKPLADLPINNMHRLLTEVARAQEILDPATWSARVLLLASPLFLASAEIVVAADGGTITKQELLDEFVRCMSLGGADAHLISLAVSGHTFLSDAFAGMTPENYQQVYDEDSYPCAINEVPALPEPLGAWKEALTTRRQEQRRLAAEHIIALADETFTDTPEFNPDLNRADLEEQSASTAPSEEDDLDR